MVVCSSQTRFFCRMLLFTVGCLFVMVVAAPQGLSSQGLLPQGLSTERGTTRLLEVFADPAEIWGPGVEAVIERAYRETFRTYIIDDRIVTVRMPFAQNNEREELAGTALEIFGKGKADPDLLWDEIDRIIKSPDFKSYQRVLGDGREKVIVFDLPSREWTISDDIFDVVGMKAGAYRGMPHRPYVLSHGVRIQETDIYNYLYAVGRIGMDCSGFVWYVLSTVAEAGGLDLGRALSRSLGAPKGVDPSLYVGTEFFDSRSPEVLPVDDRIENLKPADVILFRDQDGIAAHSAVIQSIDFDAGTIRYLQSTDEAPPARRGVHDSFIRFDPNNPGVSLKDRSLIWTQARFPPFPGERPSAFSNDGERYRAYPEYGGGKVVRLRAMAGPVKKLTSAAGR